MKKIKVYIYSDKSKKIVYFDEFFSIHIQVKQFKEIVKQTKIKELFPDESRLTQEGTIIKTYNLKF